MLNKIKMEFQNAYENTIYVVLANPTTPKNPTDTEFQIQIGEINQSLNDWMNGNGYQTAAIITACNPKGIKVEPIKNQDAMRVLMKQIEEQQLPYLMAYGSNREGTWREDSYCLFNVTQDQAVQLSQIHQQNAFVWLEANKEAELIWPSEHTD